MHVTGQKCSAGVLRQHHCCTSSVSDTSEVRSHPSWLPKIEKIDLLLGYFLPRYFIFSLLNVFGKTLSFRVDQDLSSKFYNISCCLQHEWIMKELIRIKIEITRSTHFLQFYTHSNTHLLNAVEESELISYSFLICSRIHIIVLPVTGLFQCQGY